MAYTDVDYFKRLIVIDSILGNTDFHLQKFTNFD